jgi:putative ATPase
MKDLGYGKGYQYAHDFKAAYAVQGYLPDAITDSLFYCPSDRGYERMIGERLKRWRALGEKTGKNDAKRTPPGAK